MVWGYRDHDLMCATFVAASSQALTNAAPPLVSTGYPLTVGLWANITNHVVVNSFFMYEDTATSNNLLGLRNSSTSAQIAAAAGGTAANSQTGVIVDNTWFFLLARFIGS